MCGPMTGARGKCSILIIEDDSQLGRNMALMLKMEGFEVRVAADGFAGLTLIRKKRPDLILCDILMPGMDGYAFHDAVHSLPHLNKIPFLFVSALNEPDQVRKGMLAGADDYLTKPFTAQSLLAAVNIRLHRFATLRPTPKGQGATAEQAARLRQITQREREILLLVAQGSTSREIAEGLFISRKTVDVHRARLMRKLGAANAASLAFWASLAEQTDQSKGE
jgi:DNA-binding NarL/FixJ family response regulator